MRRTICTALGLATAPADSARWWRHSRSGPGHAQRAQPTPAGSGSKRQGRRARAAGWAGLFVCAALVALPGDAAAQHRHAVRAARRAVVVHHRPVVVNRPFFYRPYFYRPYFYDPFFFGGPWYYPYGPYPPYGYYYPRFYTNASSVRIQVEPREAEVYLDGYFVGRVDEFDGFFQRLDIPPGKHEIEIYLEGYQTIHEKRLFRPRATYHIEQLMEKMPEGAPPAPRPEPNPESPRIPAEERGRSDAEYGRQPQQPGARSAFGTLAIRAQPADAIVRIDGQVWEHPDTDGPLVIELPEGTHTIDVEADAFTPFTKEVDIRRGERTPLNVSLPKR